MITEDERFIKIQGILAFSDIHPADCIKINDLIIDLSKQKEHLQSVIDELEKWIKCMQEVSNLDLNCLNATLDKLNELRGKE